MLRSRYRRKLRWRHFSGTLTALAAIALLAVVAGLLQPQFPAISGSARPSDGDSFRMDDERIRLLDIDAPELDQTCTDAGGADWPCGSAARDAMARLLQSGPVECQPQDRDQYGRILARCTLAGRDLAAAIVSQGLAVASGGYHDEEREARAARRGIWQGTFQSPRAWRDRLDETDSWGWLLNLLG